MKRPLLEFVHNGALVENDEVIDVESGSKLPFSLLSSPQQSNRSSSASSNADSPKKARDSASIRFKRFSREEFLCPICLENVDVLEMYTLTGNGQCAHKFCRHCLASYLSNRITEGQVRNPCPSIGKDNCTTEACMQDIQTLCPYMIDKYNRFMLMKVDSNYRDCPKCNRLMLCSPQNPITTCDQCAYQFCFFHSDSHPGMTCGQYARSIRTKDWASQWRIFRSTKSCPNCKTPTEKMGGCNHMTCHNCSASWCWLCGRQFDEASDHFGTIGLFNCTGGQFASDSAAFLLPVYRILYMFIILLELPLLFIVLPFYFCCAHICKCKCCASTTTTDVINLITSAVFMWFIVVSGTAFSVVWFIVSLALLPLTCPIFALITCCCDEDSESNKCGRFSSALSMCVCCPIVCIISDND